MPRKVVVLVGCDLENNETDDAPTFVSLDGQARKVDLCEEHRAEIREFLAPFLQAGKSVKVEYTEKPKKQRDKAAVVDRGGDTNPDPDDMICHEPAEDGDGECGYVPPSGKPAGLRLHKVRIHGVRAEVAA